MKVFEDYKYPYVRKLIVKKLNIELGKIKNMGIMSANTPVTNY